MKYFKNKRKIIILFLASFFILITFTQPAKALSRIADDGCLAGKFALIRGNQPETKSINMFGIGFVPVNSRSANAWKKVSNLITSSSNPEIQGIIQYMKDYHANRVSNLKFDGAKGGSSLVADGTISYKIGKAGVNRHTGEDKPFRNDMHVTGLALDFLTESNFDIFIPGKVKNPPPAAVKPTKDFCPLYQFGFNLIKKQFSDDPYHMYARIQKKLDHCLTFDDGKDPWTIFPDEFIKIFKDNGFQWGGDVFSRYRSDGMHFQYVGPCATTNYYENEDY